MGKKRSKTKKTVEEKDEDPKGRRWLVKVGFALLVVELVPVVFFARYGALETTPMDGIGDWVTYIVFGLPLAFTGTAVALPLVFIPQYREVVIGTPLLANSLWMFVPGATAAFARWLAFMFGRMY